MQRTPRGSAGRRHGRFCATAALIGAAFVLVACGPAPAGTAPAGAQNPVTPAAPVATATAASTRAPSAATADPGPTSWRMPNLVGRGLQEAQDAIQALTDNRIFLTKSHDAGGAGRRQILDRDWKVCDQNIRPGTRITAGTVIDFGAVKLSERC